MSPKTNIVIEARTRRTWLARSVFYALLPFVWLGAIDGCSAIRTALNLLRFEWRLERHGWRSVDMDVHVNCDEDDGGYPAQEVATCLSV